jgi:hypothetical protein
MNHGRLSLFAPLVLALCLSACNDRNAAPGPASSASSGSARADAITDRWAGQWNGPEGTFLRIVGAQGKYEITIQNLDGPRTFQASASGDQVEKESIRATGGAETGMKWLADKSNCLTVRAGEGYCRD